MASDSAGSGCARGNEPAATLPGLVVQLDRKVSWVELEGGEIVPCPLRGRFFEHESAATRPVAVGDRVRISRADPEQGIIEELLPRRSAVLRSAVRAPGKVQVLAANVDQVLVVVSLRRPKNRPGLVDRLLVAAESCGMDALVVVNKIDLCAEAEIEAFLEVYDRIGYPTARVSALERRGLETLRAAMKDRVSLVLGHSGVGKSSLLNALDPSLELKTGAVSERHRKGTHTTSAARLVKLDFGARVVDSPGVREFTIAPMEAHELAGCFPELREPMQHCRFQPCTHDHEPDCAVQAAVERGDVDEGRFRTYLKLLDERTGGGQRMPRHGSF